jgi:hypothetical protein
MGMQPEESGLNPVSQTRPLACTLALVSGLVRLIPHPWNFAPLGAVGLFSGARLNSWYAFAIPLGVRLFTDAVKIGVEGITVDSAFYYFGSLPFVYLSLAVSVLLGKTLWRTESAWRIGAASVAASVQFFLLTNFGSWLISPDYPRTVAGLLQCYGLGLEFYRNTVLSDIVYTSVLFGAHAWLSRTLFQSERVVALAK